MNKENKKKKDQRVDSSR